MKEGAPLVFAETESPAGKDVPRKGNVFGPGPRSRGNRGDLEKGFAEAEVVHEGTYYCPVHTHSPLETHGVVASWEGDQLTVYASTQGIFAVREGLAEALGIDRKNVRVLVRAHGRRLRQQARPLRERQRLRHDRLQAGEEGRRPGQAHARPPAGAPVHGQRPERAHDGQGRGEEGRHAHRRPLHVLRLRRASRAGAGHGGPGRVAPRQEPELQGRGVRRLHERRPRGAAARPRPLAGRLRHRVRDRRAGREARDGPARAAPEERGEPGAPAPVRPRGGGDRLGAAQQEGRARRPGPRKRGIGMANGNWYVFARRGRGRAGQGPPRRVGRARLRAPGHRHRLPHRDGGGGGRGARASRPPTSRCASATPSSPRARPPAAASPSTRWRPSSAWPRTRRGRSSSPSRRRSWARRPRTSTPRTGRSSWRSDPHAGGHVQAGRGEDAGRDDRLHGEARRSSTRPSAATSRARSSPRSRWTPRPARCASSRWSR